MGGATKDGGQQQVRLDKWLWAARCFKTRSKATAACEGGHCRVNGSTAKAGMRVKTGMRVDVQTPGGTRNLEVVALADKRGSASLAQGLFIDHTPPPPVRDPAERRLAAQPVFERAPGSGRPTKRDRRRLQRERGDG